MRMVLVLVVVLALVLVLVMLAMLKLAAGDVGDVEAGNGTAVTTMTTNMTLTLMPPILSQLVR